MEDQWPSSVGLRGQALNHPELRWLKTVVVSVRETACLTRQVGTRKTFQSAYREIVAREASPLTRRYPYMAPKPRGKWNPSGQVWRVPEYWPGGARRVGGVSLVCRSCSEREKVSVDADGRRRRRLSRLREGACRGSNRRH